MELRDYQKRALAEILKRPAVQLNAFMGSGKTATVIKGLDLLLLGGAVERVLVVAPKLVAQSTWPTEIELWEAQFSYEVIQGTPTKRATICEGNAQVHITNFEQLVWLVNYWGKDWPYDMVVVDESSKMKSHSSKRFKALKKLRPKIKRFVNMTGTFTPNGLHDVWSQIYLIDMGVTLGKNITAFRNRWFRQDYFGYNWIELEHSEDEIKEKIKPLCVTLQKEDYSELPPTIPVVKSVTMGRNLKALYKELKSDFILQLGESEVVADNAAVLSGKLRQFTAGALYTREDSSWEAVHSTKLEALQEIIEESEGPVILAYQFKFELHRLQEKYPVARTIKTPKDIDDWNKGKIPILLLHPASAGHGLNLQHGGHVIVWLSLTWSLEQYQQTNARLDRSGQTKPVVIYHILMDKTVDGAMYKRVNEKASVQDAIMDYLKG